MVYFLHQNDEKRLKEVRGTDTFRDTTSWCIAESHCFGCAYDLGNIGEVMDYASFNINDNWRNFSHVD